jgi:MFS family permease
MFRFAKQLNTAKACYTKSFQSRGNLENSAIKYTFSASEPPKGQEGSIKAPTQEQQSFLKKYFGIQNSFAKESFKSRWLMVVPAFLTHLSIGSPYGWSVLASTLVREQGFVISAAGDWTLSAATFPLSLIFATQGLVAGLVGGWQIKNGVRASIALASTFFGGGFLIGSLGIYTGQLWLLYLGYGVLGGCGIGLAYTPPLQALIDWFPDKKGLASGLALAGFGSGALLFTPLVQKLMSYFSKMPEYLGPAGTVETFLEGGKLFARTINGVKEVVLANASDIAKLPYHMAEGLYVVGSGSTGAAAALAVCGGIYFCKLKKK